MLFIKSKGHKDDEVCTELSVEKNLVTWIKMHKDHWGSRCWVSSKNRSFKTLESPLETYATRATTQNKTKKVGSKDLESYLEV